MASVRKRGAQFQDKPTAKCTVFVRNLPYDATNEGLEEVFSEVGPVKSCFVVKDKGVADKCRGFGYVTYADRSDAEKAIGSPHSLDGRKLHVKFADKKPPSNFALKKRKQNEVPGADKSSPSKHSFFKEDENDDSDEANTSATNKPNQNKKQKGQPQSNQKGQAVNKKSPVQSAQQKSIVQQRTPNQQQFAGKERNQHFDKKDNKDAKFSKKPVQKPNTDFKPPQERQPKASEKTARLVIRNLSFQCDENKLQKTFSTFGAISEVKIPLAPGPARRSRGFGFVQFKDVSSAAKAVKEMNGQEIMGRPIAVDWSLPREKFLAISKQAANKSPPQKEKPKPKSSSSSSQSETSGQDESDDDEESSDDDEESSDDDDSGEEDEDSDDSEDDDESTDEQENKGKNQAAAKSQITSTLKSDKQNQEDNKDSSDEESEDEEEEDSDESEDDTSTDEQKKQNQKQPSGKPQKASASPSGKQTQQEDEDSSDKESEDDDEEEESSDSDDEDTSDSKVKKGRIPDQSNKAAVGNGKPMNGDEDDEDSDDDESSSSSEETDASDAKDQKKGMQNKIGAPSSGKPAAADDSDDDDDDDDDDESSSSSEEIDTSDAKDQKKGMQNKIGEASSGKAAAADDSDDDSSEDSGTVDEDMESESDSDDKTRKPSVQRDSDSGSIPDETSSDEDDSDEEDGDEDGDDSDGSSGEDESDSDEDEGESKKKEEPSRPSDVGEGKTLFVRNVPFECTDEDLQEIFSKFGRLEVCKVVVDRDTEHSKGSAFVKYESKSEAEKCLHKASSNTQDEKFTLDGRRLEVSMALPRNDIEGMRKALKKQEKSVNKDKRNLYLLREGLVREGTQAAKGVSEGDMKKRGKIENIKRNKLKNINIFVSPTRMVVHNLAKSVDDAKLKKMFMEGAGEKKARIIESRIMRDMSRPNAEGKCQPLGYAFVEFTEHDHALTALRHVNNNPTYFGENKRPIVGFSLENKTALEAKMKRLGKQQNKGAQKKTEERDRAKTGPSQSEVAKKTHIASLGKEKIHTAPKTKIRKGLPSHMGPKKRWRDKGKIPPPKKEKTRMSRVKRQQMQRKDREPKVPASLKRQAVDQETGKNKKRRRKNMDRQEESNFNKLVAQYKNKLFANVERTNQQQKQPRSKWFDNS